MESVQIKRSYAEEMAIAGKNDYVERESTQCLVIDDCNANFHGTIKALRNYCDPCCMSTLKNIHSESCNPRTNVNVIMPHDSFSFLWGGQLAVVSWHICSPRRRECLWSVYIHHPKITTISFVELPSPVQPTLVGRMGKKLTKPLQNPQEACDPVSLNTDCERCHIGSDVWAFSPQLVAVFCPVVTPSEGKWWVGQYG